MNKMYRSIWNASLNTWVAAPETARSKSASSGSGRAIGAVLLLSALGSFSFIDQSLAACSVARTCTGTDSHKTDVPTDGTISGGNWSFSGPDVELYARRVSGVTGISGGAVINLDNQAQAYANANSLGDVTFNIGTVNSTQLSRLVLEAGNSTTNETQLNFGQNGRLTVNGTNTVKSLNSLGTTRDFGMIQGSTNPGPHNLKIDGGAGSSSTFSGVIFSSISELTIMSGSMTFTPLSDLGQGRTIIDNGATLIANTTNDLKSVTVYSGGTLKGTAKKYTGTVFVEGTYEAPLDSVEIDTLNLTDSQLVVRARDGAGTGNSSFIETNTLFLNGTNSLHVLAERGAWSVDRTYKVLETSNLSTMGSATDFTGNVTANFQYLTPTLTQSITGTGAYWELKLVRNGPGGALFSEDARTPNQFAVANSIDNLDPNHPIYNYVVTLPTGEPASTFDNLSGEVHSSLKNTTLMLSEHGARLSLANLRNSLNAGLNPAAASAQVGGTLGSTGLPAFGDKPAWVSIVGNWQKVDGNSQSAQLDQNSTGVFVGYDNEITNGWYLGGALGYTHTDADVSKRSSSADIDSYTATLYGGKAFSLDIQRQLNLSAGIAYTRHDIETKRKIRGLDQKLRANYDAHSTQAFAEVGYLIGKPDGRNIEPFVGLSVTHISSDSFKEKGGSAALRSGSDSETQTVSTLGVRGQTPYEFGNFGSTVYGSLAWQHAFNRTQFDRTMAFVDGGQAFSVEGVALNRDTAVVGLGTQVNLTPRAALSVDYQGRFASGMRDHSASLKAQWSF